MTGQHLTSHQSTNCMNTLYRQNNQPTATHVYIGWISLNGQSVVHRWQISQGTKTARTVGNKDRQKTETKPKESYSHFRMNKKKKITFFLCFSFLILKSAFWDRAQSIDTLNTINDEWTLKAGSLVGQYHTRQVRGLRTLSRQTHTH